MDRSTDLSVLCNDLTLISFYELIFLDRLPYLIGELFPKCQSCAKRTQAVRQDFESGCATF